MIFLRHHLHKSLKMEYLTVKDPLVLRNNIKERCDYQKMQYREKGFKKYAELISCLLVVEQNNELLLKNYKSRPTSSTPFPEVNVVTNEFFSSRGRGCKGGYKRGRGRGRGRSNYRYHGGRSNDYNSNTHQKRKYDEGQNNDDGGPSKVVENKCYRCGMKGHWACTCRMPEHLAKLYQASIEMSATDVEANLIFQNDNVEAHKNDDGINGSNAMAHLEVADFYD
ncbi:hypothetical protein QN277_026475 [Acacia crassicarpa]|uniref:CCHC-type domain-containing protein n=1 Tax=Acacia crassicarpa TaxID=499986 RepID=A0AAE1MHU1_9FABA|nr:hypothetical protein QN277_026475 [Acacia crassicarpa]